MVRLDDFAVVFITGGADGIGLALAKELITVHRASVAIADNRPEILALARKELDDLVGVPSEARVAAAVTDSVLRLLSLKPRTRSEFSVRVSSHLMDVSDRRSVALTRAAVLAAHQQKITLVVNCAGVASAGVVTGVSFADYDRVVNTNLGGTVNVCLEFLQALLTTSETFNTQTGIVNVVSTVGGPAMVPLYTSQCGIEGFTRALQMDLDLVQTNRVLVSCVHTGLVSTKFLHNNLRHLNVTGLPLASPNRLVQAFGVLAGTTPKEAAQQILRGVSWGKTRIVVGNDALAIDLLTRSFPSAMQHRMVHPPVVGAVLMINKFIGQKVVLGAISLGLLYIGKTKPRLVQDLLKAFAAAPSNLWRHLRGSSKPSYPARPPPNAPTASTSSARR